MKTIWIGIIFLSGLYNNYGLNIEQFHTEKECWEYFDKHPTFELLETHKQNHYYIYSKIKKYNIKLVGTAWVSCKDVIIEHD